MRPDAQPTLLERAEEFDIAARIAYDHGNYVFANTLSTHAHLLRMEDLEERKHDQLKKD